jgi:uncharacterized protein YeaO (DUF488 family)
MIHLKRAYDPPSEADGMRILVERLWPRGLTKERLAVKLWLKEVSPSPELRKWYGHDPEKWEEFRRRYLAELEAAGEPLQRLRELASQGEVTFVYAARDEEHNSARLLKEYLENSTAA